MACSYLSFPCFLSYCLLRSRRFIADVQIREAFDQHPLRRWFMVKQVTRNSLTRMLQDSSTEVSRHHKGMQTVYKYLTSRSPNLIYSFLGARQFVFRSYGW